MAKVKVISEKCLGCGLCTTIDSEVFELNDENVAHVKKNKVTEKTKEAKNSCPAEAIVIE